MKTTLRSNWPRVTRVRIADQSTFMVDARPTGKRHYSANAKEALQLAERLAASHDTKPPSPVALTPRLKLVAIEGSERLKPFGKSLWDAVEYYVKHMDDEKRRLNSLTMAETLRKYIEVRQLDAERNEITKASFREIATVCGKLSTDLGHLNLMDIKADTIQTYLDNKSASARTRINLRARLNSFFNFCRRKGWLERNPCEFVKIKVPKHDVQILDLQEASDLLRAAQSSPGAQFVVPYLAVSMFAGLRPGEAQQLCWENIHFETKHIEVRSHTSKTRDTRFVPMEPCLVGWLRPYRQSSGKIVGMTTFRKLWDDVKASAGFMTRGRGHKKWVPDVMRHSYASYWLALHQDRAKLADLMGNSVDVIRAHYRRPILKKVARKYWEPTPSQSASRDLLRSLTSTPHS
jgi:integrase